MKAWMVGLVLSVGCGDNLVPIGPPLEHADTLFLVGHTDDDMIFMQPDLLHALASGSVTTVYATTASPKGVDRHLFEAARTAYGEIVGSQAWDCGALELGARTVEHCRLQDRPVSLVNLDLADGGVPGDRHDCLLHLVDGTAADMPIDGPHEGRVTMSNTLGMFEALFVATTPGAVHTLELAGTHGRDHSSHMFVASFALWAQARLRFDALVTWHRGYNVDVEAVTLSGADFDAAAGMLGFYEACADHRGHCGTEAPPVLPAHATWLARQYASTRVREARGHLALGDSCLFDDCTAEVQLTAAGALIIDGDCLASSRDGTLSLGPCSTEPGQYWVLDSEGFLFNGRPPHPGPHMQFDHVRCLAGDSAPTCGEHLQPRWRFISP